MGCYCCKEKPLTPTPPREETPPKTPTPPPPPKYGMQLDGIENYEDLPEFKLQNKVGWNIDENQLSYSFALDKESGMKLIKKMQQYPKLQRLDNGCYGEVYRTRINGEEKVIFMIRHDENDAKNIDAGAKGFFERNIRGKDNYRAILAMDPMNPKMTYDEYRIRRNEYASGRITDFYKSKINLPGGDEVRQIEINQKGVFAKYFDSHDGYIKVPKSAQFSDLPQGPFRKPGWVNHNGSPYYVILFPKDDGSVFLRRLCRNPSSGLLLDGCRGLLFRNMFGGVDMMGLAITNTNGNILKIDRASRVIRHKGFHELTHYKICTDLDVRVFLFDMKHVEAELDANVLEKNTCTLSDVVDNDPEDKTSCEGSEDQFTEKQRNVSNISLRKFRELWSRIRKDRALIHSNLSSHAGVIDSLDGLNTSSISITFCDKVDKSEKTECTDEFGK